MSARKRHKHRRRGEAEPEPRLESVERPSPQEAVLDVQRRAGNRAAQPMVARYRAGRPLEPGVEAKMAQAFGADLGDVRVHTDAAAQKRAREAGAFAVAEGADISFAKGAYAPDTSAGEALLAHELAHVVQQTGPAVARRANDVGRDEAEADRVAAAVQGPGRLSGLRHLVSAGRSVVAARSCGMRSTPSREQVEETVTRADQIVQLGAEATSGQMREQLQRAGRATSFARENVGRFNAIADHADRAIRIYDAVRELDRLQGADGTFSDGRAAARQFDKLFAALGEVLESSGVPGAAQYGTLLKSVGNFFENMEGKLNPARRWEHREDWQEAMRH